MATPGTSSRWVIPLRSILTGFSIFFLGSLSDVWLQRHAGSPLIAIMDDALVGVGVGLLVGFYERRQRQVAWSARKAFQGLYHFGYVVVTQIDFRNSRKSSVRTCELTLNHVLIEPNDFDLNAEVVIASR